MDSQQANIHEIELWDLIPEDIFPKDATIKGTHKYIRETEWKFINRINERNEKIVKETIDSYKSEHPECINMTDYEILTCKDEIWDKYLLFDNIVYNSLINKDFVLDRTYKGDIEFKMSELYNNVSQYDVLFDFTLGGYYCHPFVIFGIEEMNKYGADEEWDEYASDIFLKWEQNNKCDEDGNPISYKKLCVKLFNEGHCTFTLNNYGKSRRVCIRRVERNSNGSTVFHDIY